MGFFADIFSRRAPVQIVELARPVLKATSAVLFLDFDGVLHRHQKGTLDRLPLLEEFLRAHPDVHVVISSTWRMQESLESLAEYFSEDLRDRIEGVTPVGTRTPYSRFCEVQEYLAGETRNWCAIDDEPTLFPPNCRQLVVTDPSVALTPTDLARVAAVLNLKSVSFS